MVEIVISIAAKVAEYLVDPIGRQISYAFKYQRNMEELKKQVKMLINQRESVQHSVDDANRQGDEIEKHVQEWLERVDEFAEKVAKPIIDDQVKVKKLCSIGFCPTLMTRYSLSKKAVKTAKDGVDLLGEGKFQKVSYRLPPRRANSLIIKGYEDFASRKSLSESIMEALADADTNLIGVYGMGGVGKTTLVKKVAQQAKENKLFDVVVTAVVTETSKTSKIQDQIAEELGLEFQQKTETGRAAQLREKVKKENRILVILDNVWAKLDLESIGIPVGGDEKGSITQKVHQVEGENANKKRCKILFTSRNLDVLRNDMDTQKNFKVEVLCDAEGESLFWKTVGYSQEKSDLNPIAVEIVGKCGGLPVAIKTIANALKNKSLPSWKSARDQLKKANPKNIKGMNAEVYSTIELSFNFLEGEEAKSLFLLCNLCNDGYGVNITDMLKYSMGLGLFRDVDTIEEGRDKLLSLIDDLKTSCLLMDDDDDNNFVKMHDVIHVVAVSIASTTKRWFNLQTIAGLKEELEKKLPKDSAAVSLLCRDISELPEKIEFPNLELFLLDFEDASLQIPDAVFERTKGLKVLDMTGIHLLSPPSSVRCLIHLHTLCLDSCRLEDVAIIGELKELEILSLMNSDIEQLPKEIGQLTRLRLLDLSHCSKLKVIKPNVISSLTRLEELYMGDYSFDQWDIDGQRNASLAELKQLSYLTALDIHVPNARIIPQGLSFEKLERYRIFVGKVWDWSGKCETSRTLKLKLSSGIYLINEIKSLLNRTQDVHLDKLKGVKNVVHELNGEGFPQLKHLHVQNGSEIQHIANSFGCSLCNVFPQLESMFLDNLINLEKICHGPLATKFFGKLRIMKVRNCDSLKHLFSFSMVNNLLLLQEIEVTNCKKLEKIISKENMELVHQNESIRRFEFTHLHTLTLQCLPQLTSFSFDASTTDTGSQEIVAEDVADGFMSLFSQNVVLPSLKNLKLSSINIRCTRLDQLPVISSCSRALTNLILEECNDLKFLFSYSVIQSLVQLQKLEVRNCKSIEEIINTEELRGEKKMIMMVFPKPLNLQLKGLPKLTRFSSGNSVKFFSLTQLSIQDCPKLTTFFSGSKYANKEIEEMNCHDDIHHLFNEKVGFRDIENLTVSDFPHSKEVWHEKILVSNLISLVVDDKCCCLRYIFTSSAALGLVQLQKLEIKNCANLEMIAVIEEETVTNNLFPNLYELKLINLPELSRFCNFAGNAIELPSLTHLEIENCPNMQTFISNFTGEDMSTTKDKRLTDIKPFFNEKIRLSNLKFLHLDKMDKLREIWHHQLSSNSFSKLDCFCLHNCHNVSNVFPSNMFGRLQKLKRRLCIKNCSSLYVIFELQASGCGKTQAITATPLEKLTLNDLPKLKHIWDVDSQGLLTCQNLISIEVTDCGSLKSIFPASVGRNLLRLEQLWIENCCMVEEIFAMEEQVDEAVPRFPRLTFLRLAELSRPRSFYPRVHISEWPMLKKLHFWKCDKIEVSASNCLSFQVSQGESQHEMPMEQPLLLLDKVPLNKLESLALDRKWIVKEALHEKLPEYSCKLKFLTFVGSHSEADICVSCFLHKLPHLETLHIRQGLFKEIFSYKGFGFEEKHVETPSELSGLWLFDLFDSYLSEENSISSNVFQNLEILDVLSCGNLKFLVPSSVSFQNLTTLRVWKCNGLLNLVGVPTAKSMMSLRKLSISECEMIEEIIIHEGEEVKDEIIFKKLSDLKLQCLPSLTSFYSGDYTTEFPSLQQVIVRECPSMKTFSGGVLSAPMLDRLHITEEAEGKGFWEGNLNTTIEHLFIENCKSCKED